MTQQRTLVLLRHAKAEPAGSLPDVQRPLALRGRRQSVELGRMLVDHDLVPDAVLCSPSLRTRQTWELLAPGLGGRELQARLVEDLYSASIADVLAELHELDDQVRTVLVVGHEPTVSMTADHLAGQGSDPAGLAQVRVGVPTAALSVLRSDAPWPQWGRGSAELTAVLRPKV